MVRRFGRERALNEAAALRFIADETNIPVPKLYCSFEDNEAIYLVMEYVNGVSMNTLDSGKRKVVEKGLEIASGDAARVEVGYLWESVWDSEFDGLLSLKYH